MFSALLAPALRIFAALPGEGGGTGGAACAAHSFLGLEPWYQYLTLQTDTTTGGCTVVFPTDPTAIFGSQSPFLLIGLALVDDLLRIAALVAVGYVIYGGIQYETSNGDPNGTKQAQQTIINALIGVVLAILASAIVAFIGNQLGS